MDKNLLDNCPATREQLREAYVHALSMIGAIIDSLYTRGLIETDEFTKSYARHQSELDEQIASQQDEAIKEWRKQNPGAAFFADLMHGRKGGE